MSEGTPGILLVLDGWGHAPHDDGNAISAAATPVLDRLLSTCPTVLVEASGTAVGLLPDTVGNSEIGHMVIGAGRPVPYDSVLVDQQIRTGGLRTNPLLSKALGDVASSGTALHLIGLSSDGAIHAHVDHLRELLETAVELNVGQVWIHAITDGRDVSDGTAGTYLGRIEKHAAETGAGRVASVVGRGYALDKSGDLDLTRQAGLLIADGVGAPVARPQEAVDASARGDEWVEPGVVVDDAGEPLGAVRAGDAVLFTNFRSDRIQQLADFLVEHVADRDVEVLSLAQYDTRADIPPLVGRAETGGGLADELARHGLRSVRVAENEKFEHVTYYVNGRDATARAGEEHVRIAADERPDYRARPEMNLDKVVEAVAGAAQRPEVDLVVANLANIDVVGHTGDFAATVLATEHTDRAVDRILATAAETGRWVLLVGDHGNAERMLKPGADGVPRPYGGHTTNPVPAVLVPVDGQTVGDAPENPSLADLAPTVLRLLGRPAGEVMTGRPLW
ncbi:2,3-bisphosphoglycerate-independent phosphoglycerate mutase [Umezawaea sp. NPDC059074]|uniref:2,3-bisphosphoglycerate-independent phosphoglycerate mutase n=1 Tax=Umezawaea sp. NPDC059074 TaxID=3346716 RepID=UPI0036B23CF6